MITEMQSLTVREVAAALRVKNGTVYRLLRSGQLRGFQLSDKRSSWRITQSALDEYVATKEKASGATIRQNVS